MRDRRKRNAHGERYVFAMKAAPPDAWRDYDVGNPEPGYFEFDWLSARHPDLYHAFALSSVGLVEELRSLVDLTGLEVVDVGAGTGRSTLALAEAARQVYAVDTFASVLDYARQKAAEAGVTNITHIQADRSSLPLEDNSVDAAICVWSELDFVEAHRVLRPDGLLVQMHCAPGSLCAELTGLLQQVNPNLGTETPDPALYNPATPPTNLHIDTEEWNGARVKDGIDVHDFTYVASYPSVDEAAAIYGRLYGPTARAYLRGREQNTVASRLRIYRARVANATRVATVGGFAT